MWNFLTSNRQNVEGAYTVMDSSVVKQTIQLIRSSYAPLAPLQRQLSIADFYSSREGVAVSREMIPEFNRAYYLRNLLKCEFILEKCHFLIPQTVTDFVDVGAGAGTFSHAMQSRARASRSSFELLDRSPYQITLARSLGARLGAPARIAYSCREVCGEERRGFRGRFILASYSLCEILSEQSTSALDLVFEGLGAIIIDHHSVVARISAKARRRHIPVVEEYAVPFAVPVSVRDLIRQDEIRTSYAFLSPT